MGASIDQPRPLLFFLLLILAGNMKGQPSFHEIPHQSFDILDRLGCPNGSERVDTDRFRISGFISYGEYKRYLEAVKEDSSEAFYREQLPDSGMCRSECYDQYLHSTEYDSFPVAGVPWTAAMEYCKWRTLEENEGDSLDFIYRVPTIPEWLAAHAVEEGPSDMNRNFSDWLIGSQDPLHLPLTGERCEGENDAVWQWNSLYIFREEDRGTTLMYRLVIGDSFLYRLKYLGEHFWQPYHAESGYRHISFRIVKHRKKRGSDIDRQVFNETLFYWGLKEREE